MNTTNTQPADIIVLTGPQGCGKGTLGKKLASELGYKIISTGDLIRSLPDDDPRKIWQSKGNLLSDEQIYEMIEPFIKPGEKIIFDGFPRTKAQAEWLYNQQQKGKLNINKVIYLSISKDSAIKRIVRRALKEQRADDKDPRAVANRLEKFYKNTLSAIRFLKDNGIKTQKFIIRKPNAPANENYRLLRIEMTKHDIHDANNKMLQAKRILLAQQMQTNQRVA